MQAVQVLFLKRPWKLQLARQAGVASCTLQMGLLVAAFGKFCSSFDWCPTKLLYVHMMIVLNSYFTYLHWPKCIACCCGIHVQQLCKWMVLKGKMNKNNLPRLYIPALYGKEWERKRVKWMMFFVSLRQQICSIQSVLYSLRQVA
jgi:hypothetical protein